MKKIKKITVNSNEKIMIATIDIGSTVHTGYWRSGGQDVTPFEFRNDAAGFKYFWETIWTAKVRHKAERILIGFESTGSYGEPLIHYLYNKPSVQLVQVNPKHTKRIKELGDNSPNKTDKKDPTVIANIIEFGHYMSVIVPKEAAAELRHLAQEREQIISKRTAAFNQVYGLLAKIFPEFVAVMKDLTTKSAVYLLRRYSTPARIVRLGCTALGGILRRVSRGKLGTARAQSLYEGAQHSVGITEGIQSIRRAIRRLIEEIELYNAFIATIEKQMDEYLVSIPYRESLLSIPGVGVVSAAVIIGEVGSFNEIHKSDALIKLAGLNLFEISSGKHKGNCHITKRGRALLRKTIYFAALNIARIDKRMHDYYHKLIGDGYKRTEALIAVARKLLRIMFALVRTNTMYDPDYLTKKAA